MFSSQITFRGLAPSDAVRSEILAQIENLERFYDRILGCKVVVSLPHRRHRKGKIYHVRATLEVPGASLVVTKEREKNNAHEDVYISIRDTFLALLRELEDYVKRRRIHQTNKHQSGGRYEIRCTNSNRCDAGTEMRS